MSDLYRTKEIEDGMPLPHDSLQTFAPSTGQLEGHKPDSCAAEEQRKTPPKKLWAKHKAEAVLRLLAGEDIDLLAREYAVPASTLSQWRNAFIDAGEAALRSSRKEDQKDLEIKHLKETVGDLTMDLQITKAAIQVYKEREKYPFVSRKRKK